MLETIKHKGKEMHVVITGAAGGIGREFCRLYKERGDQVTALCRQSNEELNNLGVRVIEQVDVTNLDCLRDLAFELKEIDVLINNAAIFKSDPMANIAYDKVMEHMDVNALGPLRTTVNLLSCMNEGAKVAMISSRMGSITDNSSGGHYAYRMSKAALNMAAVSLNQDLSSLGICVGVFHPGFVKTKMTSGQGDIEASEAALRLIDRIDELNRENAGRFIHSNGEELPW